MQITLRQILPTFELKDTNNSQVVKRDVDPSKLVYRDLLNKDSVNNTPILQPNNKLLLS